MKKSFGYGVLLMLVLLPVVAFFAPAHASEAFLCSVTTGTGAATNTLTPTTGTCSWGRGAVIAVQCTTATNYSVRTASGSPSAVNVPVATADGVQLTFVNNTDPYIISLRGDEYIVSVLATTAPGTCRFYTAYTNTARR